MAKVSYAKFTASIYFIPHLLFPTLSKNFLSLSLFRKEGKKKPRLTNHQGLSHKKRSESETTQNAEKKWNQNHPILHQTQQTSRCVWFA
jgi:hypothetical protein